MDWVDDGSMPVSLAKMFGVVALGVGVLASPFIYMAVSNQNAYKNDLAEMDSQPTVVFNSVTDCVNKGFDQASCVDSQKQAMDIAKSLGTSLSYSSGQECTSLGNGSRT